MTITSTHISISSLDGFPLAATHYQPTANANRTVIVINSATGVPRRFYKHFAHFLAETGFTVITYDYRGIGESRPLTLRGFKARMRDWGELDMAGVINWVEDTFTPNKQYHIGHSVGGQVAGLLNNHNKIDAMVTVSSQSGYWGLQPQLEKYRAWLFMYLVFPILTPLIGYFPWSQFASGEDLPKGVALEWARWCRSRNYLLGDHTLKSLPNFSTFSAPILAYSFTDDIWGSEKSVSALMSGYMNTNVQRRHIAPEQVGMKHIGHFGFFRPKAKALWQETLDWLYNN